MISCLMLLALQAGGLHLHTNAETGGLSLHLAHVHDADPDGHDHSEDVDLTIVELGTLWEQLSAIDGHSELRLVTRTLALWQVGAQTPPEPQTTTAAKLRPPLRAPPAAT